MKNCNGAVSVKNINSVKVQVPALIVKTDVKSGPKAKIKGAGH